jgi:mannose-1-phosphate guanylyltransferase/mannose-6-phosphate isomerase
MSEYPVVPVVLSGGSGTRLWPMSRELYPKQFIPLLGDESLFERTLRRVRGIEDVQAPVVVCNEEHRFMAAEQLRRAGVGDGAILLEPVGRNTAPAIAVAALEAVERHGDAVLLVLPADHMIRDEAAFREAAQTGAGAAGQGWLVTFGVVPARAETGFGYIRRGEPLGEGLFRVARFVEKPDARTAARYVEEGTYYWNSGMFLFLASRYLHELAVHEPEMAECCRAAFEGRRRDLDFVRLDPDAFARSPADSIDYAVMERTDRAVVVPLDAGWSDVGSWHALWEAQDHDEDGNVLVGDVIAEDTRDSYVHAGGRLVATLGLRDVVVVETADAVMVAPRTRSQEVKRIVERLKAADRDEARVHRKVYRPWGAYETLDLAERFQVKHITVNPGQSLSLQLHHHRSEHWIVVRGTARVTVRDETVLLGENESIYIPLGAEHRLENPGKIPLELIEVQSGSYLGEDDIVRLDDRYGRGARDG